MRITTRVAIGAMLCLPGGGTVAAAQEPAGFDPIEVALAFHKLTGEPLDLRAWAERSDVARRASQFDRPDVVKAEEARLQALLDAADPSRPMVIQVSDVITQYDHDRGEFSIQLFMPGYYIPAEAFGREYKVVFANAQPARSIPMPKEEARTFDAMLNRMGRRVTNEIHFRIVGKGDPAGAITGERVVRAEIDSARLLDDAGRLLFTPRVGPTVASGAVAAAPAFDPAAVDVAGFRVGVSGRDFEATLARLFGPVSRSAPEKAFDPGFVTKLEVNGMGCMKIPGRRNNAMPGSVCVTAMLDKDDVVRSIRIERLFAPLDGETFRKTMTDRYGPVTLARGNGYGYMLGWGPDVSRALGADGSTAIPALSAYYNTSEDLMSIGGNRLADIRVTLHLVDSAWLGRQAK